MATWTTDPNNSRIKWLTQNGGTPRAYGDFRDFAQEGGKQESLGTTDPNTAEILVSRRLSELQDLRNNKKKGLREERLLGEFSEYHLKEKAEHESITERALAYNELCLARATKFFGEDIPLSQLTVKDMNRWVTWLKKNVETRNGRATPSGSSLTGHLNALSNLYRRAVAEDVLPLGFNPVAAMLMKPGREDSADPEWFEHDEACAILYTARNYVPPRASRTGYLGQGRTEALLATFLLTGGRTSEILGLLREDVNFERKTVRFRENSFRRLKTRQSKRIIRLWPQLEEILTKYLNGSDAPGGELLFPSPRMARRSKGEHRIKDFRKTLDNISEAMGGKEGEIRSKAFRHTYCAARLQTLDHGHPVPIYTVSKEMGHGGTQMVKRVYGHLGTVRHRSEVVEFPEETGKAWFKKSPLAPSSS